jgi:7-cyano-7-deazaguanine synthase
MKNKRCIVLLSGGLDSTTTLYLAKARGYEPFCLIFDYGQRHRKEVRQAQKICRRAGCASALVKIALPWKGSSLLDRGMKIPQRGSGIPNTYVPARNIIFLSFALSAAEALKAGNIFIGANAVDYSGYPDCRPAFYRSFSRVIRTGTKSGVEGRGIRVQTPLIRMSKAGIIRKARALGVPLALTWSCYAGGRTPCGVCDSCRIRAKGFREA